MTLVIVAVVFITLGFGAGYWAGARLWANLKTGVLGQRGSLGPIEIIVATDHAIVQTVRAKPRLEIRLTADTMDRVCRAWIRKRGGQ